MSLRATALGFRWRSNLNIREKIASGKEQVRPRNDIFQYWVEELIIL
jgi:hypothetical protein